MSAVLQSSYPSGSSTGRGHAQGSQVTAPFAEAPSSDVRLGIGQLRDGWWLWRTCAVPSIVAKRSLVKAVSAAPSNERASWILTVEVGSRAISCLAWAIGCGSLQSAAAMVGNPLTFRADRVSYYYGADELRHCSSDLGCSARRSDDTFSVLARVQKHRAVYRSASGRWQVARSYC